MEVAVYIEGWPGSMRREFRDRGHRSLRRNGKKLGQREEGFGGEREVGNRSLGSCGGIRDELHFRGSYGSERLEQAWAAGWGLPCWRLFRN